jgi:hypothetical protein
MVGVVAPAHVAAQHSTFFPVAVKSADFTKSICAMVGDGNRININSEYTVHEVHIDAASFVDGLSSASKSALRKFVANPDSFTARRRFQRSLPDEALPPAEHTVEQYRARPQVTTTIEGCAIGVVGDDNVAIVNADYQAPMGELDLGHVLKHDDAAAKALACRLGQPHDEVAQRAFDRCVARAIDPEMLRSVLDNADFDGGRTTVSRFFGSARVDGAIAGTIGAGAKMRSTIIVRAHEVALDDVTALDTVAVVEDDPETDHTHTFVVLADPDVGAEEEPAERFRQVQLRQAAIEKAPAARRRRRRPEEIEEELEEI